MEFIKVPEKQVTLLSVIMGLGLLLWMSKESTHPSSASYKAIPIALNVSAVKASSCPHNLMNATLTTAVGS